MSIYPDVLVYRLRYAAAAYWIRRPRTSSQTAGVVSQAKIVSRVILFSHRELTSEWHIWLRTDLTLARDQGIAAPISAHSACKPLFLRLDSVAKPRCKGFHRLTEAIYRPAGSLSVIPVLSYWQWGNKPRSH